MNLTNEKLETKAEEVTDFKASYLKAIKVKDWLKGKPAYAIAFNQLGLEERCFVANRGKSLKLKSNIIFNPSYKAADGFEEIESEEKCLSYPGQKFKIKRFDKVRVEYFIFDIGSKIKKIIDDLKGTSAIVFQHETDHLNGITDIMKDEDLKKIGDKLDG